MPRQGPQNPDCPVAALRAWDAPAPKDPSEGSFLSVRESAAHQAAATAEAGPAGMIKHVAAFAGLKADPVAQGDDGSIVATMKYEL